MVETLGVKPEVYFEENLRGWISDNPLIFFRFLKNPKIWMDMQK
jgi:hypothetical protein